MAIRRKRNDLTLQQKYEIVKILDQKFWQKEISIKFECSQPTVSKIKTSIYYRVLPDGCLTFKANSRTQKGESKNNDYGCLQHARNRETMSFCDWEE